MKEEFRLGRKKIEEQKHINSLFDILVARASISESCNILCKSCLWLPVSIHVMCEDLVGIPGKKVN